MARISSIYHHANPDPPTGEEAKRRNMEAFKRAWHEFGLVTIYPDQIHNDWDRQHLINLAEQAYGKRGK